MSTRRDVLIGLSLLAATVHAWLAPSHLAASAVAGLGFVLAACLQTWWTIEAVSGRVHRTSGLVINLALVAVWAGSRVAGWEPVGVLDALTVAAELALCGILLGSERARQAGVVIGAALLCVVASGMGAH